jgi:hypothetical protein
LVPVDSEPSLDLAGSATAEAHGGAMFVLIRDNGSAGLGVSSGAPY